MKNNRSIFVYTVGAFVIVIWMMIASLMVGVVIEAQSSDNSRIEASTDSVEIPTDNTATNAAHEPVSVSAEINIGDTDDDLIGDNNGGILGDITEEERDILPHFKDMDELNSFLETSPNSPAKRTWETNRTYHDGTTYYSDIIYRPISTRVAPPPPAPPINCVPGGFGQNSIFDYIRNGRDRFGNLNSPIVFGSSSIPYSGTNVQVPGVDELDTMKTNGEYIFVTDSFYSHNYGPTDYSFNDQIVKIIDINPLNPDDMRTVSSIESNQMLEYSSNRSWIVHGLFLNSNNLVVISSAIGWSSSYLDNVRNVTEGELNLSIETYYHCIYPARTIMSVFDISNPFLPRLSYTYGVTGSFVDARMSEDTVLLVTSDRIYREKDGQTLPVIFEGEHNETICPDRIYYDDGHNSTTEYYNILQLELKTGNKESKTIIGSGYYSGIYMSGINLYLSFMESGWAYDTSDTTQIYRIESGKGLRIAASGDVKGFVPNPFFMDEYKGHLRVISTTWSNLSRTWERISRLAVLDMKLDTVGSIDSIGEGKRITSVRFMQEECYVVTDIQTEPFYAIDLSHPRNPFVIGKVLVPGFSAFLYPISGDYVLGFGYETDRFGQRLGFAITMYNVSDIKHPDVEFRYIVGDGNANSSIYIDPGNLLFDLNKSLLVIPATVSDEWRNVVYQGAYIFEVTIDGGISYTDRVTHYDPVTIYYHSYYNRSSSEREIKRSLYVGDTLYTISDDMIKAYDIDDFTEIGRLIY